MARLCGFKTVVSVASAPLFTLGALSVLTALYGIVGIDCSWANTLLPLTLTPVLFFCVRMARGSAHRVKSSAQRSDWLILVAYTLFGVAVCLYAFVGPLDGANSYHITFDGVTHLNVVRSMAESGVWSSLEVSSYPDQAIAGQGIFYPNLWHQAVALVLGVVPTELAVAVNACTAVIAGVVFPTSSFAFMTALFPENRQIIALGSVATMAFGVFPWLMIFDGVLYANLLANALLPGFVGCFILALGAIVARGFSISGVLSLCAVCVLGAAALVFSQTNALFSAYVFLAPYLAGHVYREINNTGSAVTTKKWFAPIFFIVASALIVAVWVAMCFVPALSNVVNYRSQRNFDLPVGDAVYNAVSLAFSEVGAQWLLAGVVLIGLVTLVARKRFSMVIPPLYMILGFLAIRTISSHSKVFLTGFWYNDPRRLACGAVIFLVPAASVGLWVCLKVMLAGARSLFRNLPGRKMGGKAALAVVTAVALIVFCGVNFYPNYHEAPSRERITTSFGKVRETMASSYAMKDPKVYSPEEQEFVRKVKELLPKDAIVINQPHDGSVFSYGIDGLNTYFRQLAPSSDDADGQLVGTSLADFASNPDVKSAVRGMGAEYVLLLDQSVPYEEGVWLSQYKESALKRWEGLNRITDDTPGFETVLADGDMRLYKIVE